jgi:hypothetical protein
MHNSWSMAATLYIREDTTPQRLEDPLAGYTRERKTDMLKKDLLPKASLPNNMLNVVKHNHLRSTSKAIPDMSLGYHKSKMNQTSLPNHSYILTYHA